MTTADLNLIRTFVAIYETGSVSGAARRLSITQPSVSHSLGRLRDLLDDPLFTRSRAGMAPTYHASQLYQSFRAALDDIESAIAATRDFAPERSTRRFRLALSDLGELHFLPPLVSAIRSAAPSIELEVVQLDNERVSEWLLTGRVDAAVGALRAVGGQARKTTLFTETYACLVSSTHPFIGDKIDLKTYSEASHIVVASSSGHSLIDDAMTEKGLVRKVALTVPHFTNVAAVVATSDMILTLPKRMAQAFSANDALRKIELPFEVASFDVNLYWQVRAADLAAQKWFCDTITRVLSDI